jgi:HlyD family secretion protein
MTTVPPHTPRPGRVSVWPLLVAAAGFAAGLAAYHHAPPRYNPFVTAPSPPDGPAARAAPTKVVALGRLRPAGGLRTLVGPPGDQIAQLLVKEGDAVNAGQPLVEFASRADRRADLVLIDRQIADAREQLKVALTKAEGDLAAAEAKVEEMTTVVPLEIKAQDARKSYLEQQRANLDSRIRGLRELQRLSPNTVAEQDVESQELLLAQTVAELRAGQVLRDKAVAAQTNGEKVARLQLKAAAENLERVRKEDPVATLQTKRDLAQLQYDRTALLAPVAGVVVKVTAHVGDATAPQQPILQLAAAGDMVAVAEVHERDVQTLRAWVAAHGSAPAKVSSPALPGPLTGTVRAGQIGTVIARNTAFDVDPTADADRRVFEVVVTIDAADRAVAADYLNLQVRITFSPPGAP